MGRYIMQWNVEIMATSSRLTRAHMDFFSTYCVTILTLMRIEILPVLHFKKFVIQTV